MAKHHCNGQANGCSTPAAYRVEWVENKNGLPGSGKVRARKACGMHLASLVREGQAIGSTVMRHVHVLPVGSDFEWWR